MNNSKSVTANFTQITYTLTITSPNGSITKSPDKASYSYNENVTLTAVPQAGYTFASWSGDASGATNPLNLVINGNTTVGANFTAVIPVEVIVTPEVRPPVITAPDNSSPSQSAPSAADSDNNTESANVDNAARVIIVYGNTTAPPPPQRSILPSLPSVTQAVAVSRAELNSASQPVPAAENREISPAGYTYNQNLGQDDGVYYTPTPNPKVIALSDNKLIMPDNNAREENFITKPKEPVFPPRVEAKRVGSFFGIWGKYKLELKNTSSIPVYWELAKNEKLPFGINLDYEQGIISGITLGKKEIKVTLAVTLENKDNINVTCLISM